MIGLAVAPLTVCVAPSCSYVKMPVVKPPPWQVQHAQMSALAGRQVQRMHAATQTPLPCSYWLEAKTPNAFV